MRGISKSLRRSRKTAANATEEEGAHCLRDGVKKTEPERRHVISGEVFARGSVPVRSAALKSI